MSFLLYFACQSTSKPTVEAPIQKPNIIQLNSDNPTPYNSNVMTAPIESGQLILFPSSTFHGVIPNKTDTNRYSLSFNTWTHNDLGDESYLTYCSTK